MLELAKATWPEAEKAFKEKKLVIIPLGAVEEHGYHLPLSTDTILAEFIGRAVAERLDAILMPSVNYGYVLLARGFPGSVSLRENTLKALFDDICKELHRQGVRRVVVVNQHLPNAPPLRILSQQLWDEIGLRLLCVTLPGITEVAKEVCKSKQWHPAIIHSEEIETSLVLAVEPKLVRLDKAVKEYPAVPKSLDSLPIPWREFSKSGAFGDPTVATSEKGRRMLERLIDNIVEIILASEKEAP
jgi:creatinine amidohydrolase